MAPQAVEIAQNGLGNGGRWLARQRWRTRETLKPPERESRAEEVRLPPIPGPAAEQVALRFGDRASISLVGR
jgi:hypothetical protein